MVEYGDIELVEEEDIGEVYVTYDIATYPSDLSVQVLVDQLDAGDIVIPKFQRGYVWTIKQASLLIESILLGLPVPPVFFYVDSKNRSLVIDGQQRLRSIQDFLGGYFGEIDSRGRRKRFALEGISKNAPFYGRTFSDLDDIYQRKLRNSVVRSINIRQLAPDDSGSSMFHIFERLNTGGTPLSAQEIRNCVYFGDVVAYFNELNRHGSWRQILGTDKLDKRARDVELVVRLMGMALSWRKYERPMKEFLNKTMKRFRAVEAQENIDFRRSFEDTCDALVDRLGPKPFRLSGPLNTAILDSVFTACIPMRGNLPDDFANRYARLVKQDSYLEAVTRSTADNLFVERRISMAISYLAE